MPGKVSVFNLYNEPISGLSVSGYSAGNVAGYNPPTSSPAYQPGALATPVSRAAHAGSSALFVTGDNNVIIPWESFTGTVTITMPDPTKTQVSIDDDLIIYLATNLALVVTTRGFVLSSPDVTLATGEGEPVAAEVS